MTTILITNIDGQPGARLARHLGGQSGLRLLGMGQQAADSAPEGCELYSPPLSGLPLAEFLRAQHVDVVAHLDIAAEEQGTYTREYTLQQHVIGTMLLLGACARAGVRRVILRSSTMVYGAYPNTPAFIPEDWPLARARRTGLRQNYSEVELFAAEFARTHPDLEILLLRCAPLLGGGVWSVLTHYLAQPAPRMLLGFNPRIQLLHPDDAAAAFALAVHSSATGALNLAAADPLTLKQAVRLAGKQPVQVPEPLLHVASWVGLRGSLLGAWPFERGFLRYACVADTRRAQTMLGWQPQHSTKACLRDLAAHQPARDAAPPTRAERVWG